jgi:sulfotransferase family protein
LRFLGCRKIYARGSTCSTRPWLRILIANASYSLDEPIDINKLAEASIASDRASFDYAALIDSGLLTDEEVDWLRPRIHAHYAQLASSEQDCAETPRGRFIKVHDAYALNWAGEPLFGGTKGASGAILIVRDPRDVASSLAYYMDWSIDETIKFMNDDNAGFNKKTTRRRLQLRQVLRGWSDHARSWLDQKDIPVHLVRYEDLRCDTASIAH